MDDQGLPPIEIVPEEPRDPETEATAVIRRLRRRQRILAGALAAVAVVGPVAGASVAGDGRADAPVSAASDGGEAAPSDGDEGSATTSAAAERSAEGSQAVAAGEYAGGYVGAPLEWLGAGTVGGADVRLFSTEYNHDDGNPFWDPPPGCFSIGSWTIEVSSPRFAAAVAGERLGFPDRPDGTVHLVGAPEGDPRWIAVAAVDPGTARFTLPDGQEVPALDIGGVAIASAPAPGWADVPHFEDGHRASVTTAAGTFDLASWWYPDETFHAEHCMPPPPSLPEPGEQPTDPEVNRKAVEVALYTVFGDPDTEAKRAVIEHPEVILAAMEAVAQNYQGITTTAAMTDLVFTAPDTAFFLYDLDAHDIAHFEDQIGEARLLEGRWVITTETICTQLRKGGVTCEAPA